MERKRPNGYEAKFSQFIELCEKSKRDDIQQIIVAQPQTLGDTYEEIIESLSRLAEAGLTLHISNTDFP